MSEGAPREQLRQLLRKLGQCAEVVECCFATLRVAGLQRRSDELPEQRRLAVGSCPERTQVPRRDPVRRKLRANSRDLGVAGRVPLLSPTSARLEQPVLLELANELRRGAGALLDLARAELLLRACQTRGTPAAVTGSPFSCPRRRWARKPIETAPETMMVWPCNSGGKMLGALDLCTAGSVLTACADGKRRRGLPREWRTNILQRRTVGSRKRRGPTWWYFRARSWSRLAAKSVKIDQRKRYM
jgi:hypothetical protein